MLPMETGRFLIGAGERQQLRLAIETTEKGKADRRPRSAHVVVSPVLIARRFWRVIAANSIGQNHRRMARKIGNHQLLAACRSDNHIKIFEYLCHAIHRQPPRTARLYVLDRWNESRRTERIRPILRAL